MRWPYPRTLAHRGGGALAPENTLAALRFAARLGFRGVEIDARLARDGVPVLMHDETVARTTQSAGEVARLSSAELARLDAGAWKGPQWRGEPVPTLEAALELCATLGLWPNVEIKPAAGYERDAGEAVARTVARRWPPARPSPLLSSFSEAALDAARAVAPAIPRALLVERPPADWRERARRLGCVALHCAVAAVDEALVREAHAAGLALLAWTVDDLATARSLLAVGVDALVTDALERIGPDFGS